MKRNGRLVLVALLGLAICWASSVASVAPAESASGGDAVVGVVTFDGPPPDRQRIPLRDRAGKMSDCHPLHQKGLLDETLLVGENKGIGNVFIYVKKGYERKEYPSPAKPAVLNQVGCMFRPRVQGVMVGQEIVMKNGDPVLHNVRALSFRNRPFNVAQPANSPDRTKAFKRKEKAVAIACDLHPWMKSYVFVMDHPWFAVTDEKGQFRINDLPPGKYTLAAWHEELGEQDIEVTVDANEPISVELSFKPKKNNIVAPKLSAATPHTDSSPSPGPLPAREFVRKWKLDELAGDASAVEGRSIERGREVFTTAGCIKCHAMAGKGAKYGPELAEVTKRFRGPKLLQQILQPSVEIHKEFQTQMFRTADGIVISGLVVKDEAKAIHVLPNPLKPNDVNVVEKSSIAEQRQSKVSTMPEGLLDTFKRDEILDLLAYLQFGEMPPAGKPSDGKPINGKPINNNADN